MGTRTVTYVTGTVNGTVGSGIAMMDNILVTNGGWTKAYSATNEAAYQMLDAPFFYLYVNDNAPGAGGAQEMQVRGYESMTSISSGTNPFPLTTQVSVANGTWRKSNTADTTDRNYYAVVDGAYVTILCNFGAGATFDVYRFGKIEGYDSTDTFNVLCATRGIAASSSSGRAHNYGIQSDATSNISTAPRAAFARTPDGLFLSPTATVRLQAGNSVLGYSGNDAQRYPGKQGFLVGHFMVAGDLGGVTDTITQDSSTRGALPFEFEPIIGFTISSLATLDTMTSTPYDAASGFLFWDGGSSGRVILQTAGTWKAGAA